MIRTIRTLGVVAPLLAGAWLLVGPGGRGPDAVPSVPEVVRLLDEGGGRNVAVTMERSIDPRLQPRRIPAPPAMLQVALADALSRRTRWHVAGARSGVLWATHSSGLFRFVDDVFILLVPGEGETTIYARSASRRGRDDLGRNRRNLGEVWEALDDWMTLHVAPIPGTGPTRAVTASRDADP